MRNDREELYKFFDSVLGEKYRPGHYHITKPRRPRKEIPEWALDDKKLKLKVLGPAYNRYRVAYLYWRVNQNSRDIAHQLEMTVSAVESIIRQLKRL